MFSGKTILITGGAGFIGSHLVRKLLKPELNVKKIMILDSFAYGKRSSIPRDHPKVSMIQHELGIDEPTYKSQIEGTDYVFHLAAEKHNQSIDSSEKVLKANVIGMQSLLEICADIGVSKFLFTSSLYAYGRMNGPAMKENDSSKPDTIYGISKLAGENLLRYHGKRYGLSCHAVRYFFVYGPFQFPGTGYKSVIVKNFERMIKNQEPTIYGNGEQVLDYIYIDDAVSATLQVMQHGKPGELYNVGSGIPYSINQLTKSMIEVLEFNSEPLYQPPDWTQNSHRVGNIDKIKSELNWNPEISMIDGLTETYHWVKNHLMK